MKRLGVISIVGALLLVAISAAAQLQPPADGITDSGSRRFIRVGGSLASGIQVIETRAAAFRTADDAVNAVTPWFTQMLAFDADYDTSGVRAIGVDALGDTTQLMTGPVAYIPDDETLYMAFLAVQVGNTVFTYIGYSFNGHVADDLVDTAKRHLGLEDPLFPPVAGIAYREGGIWDRLPRVEHMPEGFAWDQDTQPCVGLLATTSCPVEATPQASPVLATPV